MPTFRSIRPPHGARRTRVALASALAAPLGLTLAGAAAAQASDPNPYYIGATLGFTHDSNVFRNQSATSDTYYSAGLLGGFDQPIGRQRVYGAGVVRHNRYNDLSRLNNTSYGVNAGLDWQTIYRLSGTVAVSANQSLVNYGDDTLGQTTSRNLEKSNQALASVQFGGASVLVLQGAVTHRNLSYSEPLYQANGLTQNAISGGVVYRPSSALSLGVGLRFTKGKYDFPNSNFDRRDIDFTTTWVPSGLSTINARLSFGEQDSTDVGAAKDFSGASGYLSWLYTPTGKLRFNTWVSRDTGAESSFFNVNNNGTLGVSRGDTSDVTNTVAVDATYAVTAKISANAGLRTAYRSRDSIFGDGSDRLYGASLGASYQALRNLLFACGLARETRSASGALTNEYGVTTVSCSVQAMLR